MTLVYSDEPLKKDEFKVFLAGPSPRTKEVKSWRTEFIYALKKSGFKSTIFVPENKDNRTYDCEAQTPWEDKNLKAANLIAFWIPRNLKTMPGFTTNVEFGEYLHSNKIVVGFPKDAPSTEYIRVKCKMNNIPQFYTIEEIVKFIINKEMQHLHSCSICEGAGSTERNGRLYTCRKCKGQGYILKKNERV